MKNEISDGLLSKFADDGEPIALVYEKFGEPKDVLRILPQQLLSSDIPSNSALVRVSKRLIHHGDLHVIRAAPNAGRSSPIPPSDSRTPGFEGVGIIEALGKDIAQSGQFFLGQRVAFFSGNACSWATRSIIDAKSLIAIPNEVRDDIAAQALINTVTARTVLRAGRDSLPKNFRHPVYVLQTAAASAVGRLITRLAIDEGIVPIRIVRSLTSVQVLNGLFPGVPVFATEQGNWRVEVSRLKKDKDLLVAFDAVGGSFLNELADLLDSGASIVNYGWLGQGAPALASFAARELSIRGVSIGGWFAHASDEIRFSDFEVAMQLAREYPELFEVEAEYPLAEFQQALAHFDRPGRIGGILLTS